MKYCDTCHTTYPNEFSACPKDQAPLRETAEMVEGMVIREKYQIVRKLGEGRMATVYQAKHLTFNETRALKVLQNRLAQDEAFVNRFKTEAGRRENAFEKSVAEHKVHHDVLSKKFDEMLKLAKEHPDEPPPKRDIDFD